MNRAELRLRVLEALIASPHLRPDSQDNIGLYLNSLSNTAKWLADKIDPPRKPPKPPETRNAKGRFASRTAQDAAEDEEIHAMAQALPEERHPAVDPYAPLRSFDSENGRSP